FAGSFLECLAGSRVGLPGVAGRSGGRTIVGIWGHDDDEGSAKNSSQLTSECGHQFQSTTAIAQASSIATMRIMGLTLAKGRPRPVDNAGQTWAILVPRGQRDGRRSFCCHDRPALLDHAES